VGRPGKPKYRDAVPEFEAVGRLLSQPPELGVTLAVVAVHGGEIVVEAYGPETDAGTTLISWSTAKSVIQALVGIAVRDGLLELDEPAPVAEWHGDERAAITIRHLLTMTPGLRFVEDYVDAGVSDCLEMLFGTGQHDVAAYATALPLEHSPGTVWNYSSGTTNIVARILGERVGGGRDGMHAWMTEQLFGPLGMTSADPRFDEAGTFVGSSYLYASARDFARFGSLYLDGGRNILPTGWVEFARTPVPVVPPDEPFGYGAHWWLWADWPGAFAAHGYEGQYILVVPDRDLVLVRLGKTPADLRPNLVAVLRDLVEEIAMAGSPG
jgi:CubicO group peptidase (beta-lactamase class C family)